MLFKQIVISIVGNLSGSFSLKHHWFHLAFYEFDLHAKENLLQLSFSMHLLVFINDLLPGASVFYVLV